MRRWEKARKGWDHRKVKTMCPPEGSSAYFKGVSTRMHRDVAQGFRHR